jgi:hypothetical protein
MNIFTDTLFLFTFIFAMLYFDVPNINDDHKILHKFYLFVSITVFYFLIQLIKKIKNKCKIEPSVIFQQSIMTGLICILGYSLYIDFTLMERYKEFFEVQDDKTKKICIVSMTIVGFYLLIELSLTMFTIDKNICT